MLGKNGHPEIATCWQCGDPVGTQAQCRYWEGAEIYICNVCQAGAAWSEGPGVLLAGVLSIAVPFCLIARGALWLVGVGDWVGFALTPAHDTY